MKIDFEKGGGLVPAIVQDATTQQVLMLGYMNKEAWGRTQESGKVTFFSRSRDTLWEKGETSGNFLAFHSASVDCDGDSILIQAVPVGPTCHLNRQSCFEEAPGAPLSFLSRLEKIVGSRFEEPAESSYVSSLLQRGIGRVAQKVGEEGVEVVIAALGGDEDALRNESADLIFHLLLLLRARGLSLSEVVEILEKRHLTRAQ